jgi:hypothetical protein
MTHEEHAAVEDAFIAGFREARDKPSFLRLARIPLELDRAGKPGLKLMQVVIAERYDVGRASPAFASRELVYHPLPGRLVTAATRLFFRYVSAEDVRELDLAELMHLADEPGAHRPSPGTGEHPASENSGAIIPPRQG